MNLKRPTPRQSTIERAKVKERILKVARKKQSATYKGTNIRLLTDFSAETLQARKEWHDIFKVMKKSATEILCSAWFSIRIER